MRNRKAILVAGLALALLCPWALAQSNGATDAAAASPDSAAVQTTLPPVPVSFDQVIDRVVVRERFFNQQMRHLHPLVETYLQNLKTDRELGPVAVSDRYFLGRLDLSDGVDDRSNLEPARGRDSSRPSRTSRVSANAGPFATSWTPGE